MPWPAAVLGAINQLDMIKRQLKEWFTDRDRAIDLLVLATVCREHLLLIGPPGTAKTEVISRYTSLLDMHGFYYLLTRFTEPSELFGPLDLEAFQRGRYHIRTEGMLPETQIAFLDEVFQGSSAILNSLLTLINERVFYNGSQRQPVPLLSMIGASNSLPDDPSLVAFADRLVLRCEVDKVPDEQVDDLLEQGWSLERERIDAEGAGAARLLPRIKSADVLALHRRLLEVDVSRIRPEFGAVIRELRAEGVDISDRRAVKGLKLVAGAALLREANAATTVDLWPLLHMWTRPEEADVIRTVLQPRFAEAGAGLLDLTRTVDEILLDLDAAEAQESSLSSEVALGAYLTSLNKLRRELITDHPLDLEARRKVDEAIQRGLKRMEMSHV